MTNEADETPKGTDTAGRLDGLVGPRFFIDHGIIHDRKTGRHIRSVLGDGEILDAEVHETLRLLNEMDAATQHVGGLRESYVRDVLTPKELSAMTIKSEMENWKQAYEEEANKFQHETLRTSRYAALLREWCALHELEHGPGPWARGCIRCRLVGETHTILGKPINESL